MMMETAREVAKLDVQGHEDSFISSTRKDPYGQTI